MQTKKKKHVAKLITESHYLNGHIMEILENVSS